MPGFFARRMARGPYWLLVLCNSVAALLLIWSIGFIMRHLMADHSGRPSVVSSLWLMNPLFLALLHLPTLIGTIWRLHDTGHRSWPVWLLASYPVCLMSLVYLGPAIIRTAGSPVHSAEQAIMALYGFYGLQLVLTGVLIRNIYLCCLRGDAGPNAYGPPPGDDTFINPTGPDESGEVVSPPVTPSITARIAPPQKRAFGRRNG